MRFQTLDADNRIINNTRFGRRLRRFLRQPEQRVLLPRGDHWRTGGAWILADALVGWSGRQLTLAGLQTPTGELRHVVAVEPGIGAFLDADGVAGAVEMMTKLAVVMRAPNVLLAEFDADAARRGGLTFQADVALDLAMRILHHFGPYQQKLLLPRPPAEGRDASVLMPVPTEALAA
jgi:hypothetical protein